MKNFLIALAAAVACVGAFVIYSQNERLTQQALQLSQVRQQARSAPKFTHEIATIAAEPFGVAVREMKSVKIVVTDHMRLSKLSGHFSASGGSGNDIEVLLFTNQDDLTNWQNGHAARCLYRSGRATVGTLDVPLVAAGTYVLVFDNRFSFFSSKPITTNLKLEYDSLATDRTDAIPSPVQVVPAPPSAGGRGGTRHHP